jgi:hypothetical protein
MLVMGVLVIVQSYILRNSLSKMNQAVIESLTLSITGDASHLVVLKKIEHYYKNTNKGPEFLARVIEVQKNTISSHLQTSSTPAIAIPDLENSLKCEPKFCKTRASNKRAKSTAH